MTPSAWTADIWRDDNKTFLCWGASLSDPGGHELSFERSNNATSDAGESADMHAEARLDSGEWTDQSPVPGVDGATIKDPEKRVAVKLSYNDGFPAVPGKPGSGGRHEVVLRAEPFATIKDARYEPKVPPAWRYRGLMYLAKLERLHAVAVRITGRPGPELAHVNWRLNSNNAVASVGNPRGGDQGLRMSMPLSGLDLRDPFDMPPMLEHEMLHNFGYPHGPEMSARQSEADIGFAAARGVAVAHTEWVP